MIDLVLVKRDMLRYVQDMRAVRGMGRGLSGHYVVLFKSGWYEHGLRGGRWWLGQGGLEVRN